MPHEPVAKTFGSTMFVKSLQTLAFLYAEMQPSGTIIVQLAKKSLSNVFSKTDGGVLLFIVREVRLVQLLNTPLPI